MLEANRIGFRNLRIDDLHFMHKWLNTDFVIQWYEKRHVLLSDIENKYIPRIRGEKPVRCFLILYEDEPIGYIQTYKLSDFPDYMEQVGIDEDSSGLDLFIGEADYIHKGLGKHIIIKFLEEKVFGLTDSVSCIIGPEPKNTAAIRAYEKVGFIYVKTIHIPNENEPEYIMRIGKEEFLEQKVLPRG